MTDERRTPSKGASGNEAPPAERPAEGGSFFRLRSGSPLVAILAALALIALAGLGAALALGTDHDIEPFAPQGDRVLAHAPSPLAGLGLAHATLGQIQPPTPPTDTVVPTDTPTADPIGTGDEGERVRLAGGLSIKLPEPWTIRTSDESAAYLDDGRGGWFAVRVLEWERTQPASDLLAEELGRVVPGESTSRLETSGFQTHVPFGELVSWAAVGYSAVRTDSQGAAGVAGAVYAFVRTDGLALAIATERTPPAHWEDEIGSWADLFKAAASAFSKAPI